MFICSDHYERFFNSSGSLYTTRTCPQRTDSWRGRDNLPQYFHKNYNKEEILLKQMIAKRDAKRLLIYNIIWAIGLHKSSYTNTAYPWIILQRIIAGEIISNGLRLQLELYSPLAFLVFPLIKQESNFALWFYLLFFEW